MGGDNVAGKVYDYGAANPDVLFRGAGAVAPMVGAPWLQGPLNLAAGVAGVSKSNERNTQYSKDRADAEMAVNAFKNAKTPEEQAKVTAPTTEQWLLANGQNVPQQRQDVARQTMNDMSQMSAQSQQRRQDMFAKAAQPLQQLRPPQPMGGGGGGGAPFPTAMRQGGGGAGSALQQGGGSADLLARFLAAMKQQPGR